MTSINKALTELTWDDLRQWAAPKSSTAARHTLTVPEVMKKIDTKFRRQYPDLDSLIVKPSAYEEAAIFLRKMRTVYQQTDRLQEWRGLISALRTEHKPKRRLMEALEGKRIMD